MARESPSSSVLATSRVGDRSLLDALLAAAAVDLESVLAVLDPLPFTVQLQAIGELYEGRQLATSEIDQERLTYPTPPSLRLFRELGDEGVEWARSWAPALVRDPHSLRARPGLHRLVFLALARGRAEIDPAWEPALWIGGGDEHLAELARELVLAFPAERRTPVVLAQMERQRLPSEGILGTVAVLDLLDSTEVARRALEMASRADFPGKKQAVAALQASVERRGGKGAAKTAPPLRLRSLGVSMPRREDELSAIEREQLDIVSRDFLADDASLTPARLLADGLVERHAVGAADGAPLYDVWLVMSDTGGVFHAGSTRELAPIAQGSIELADARTKAALEAALRPPAAKKPDARKKISAKSTRKKSAAKKRR